MRRNSATGSRRYRRSLRCVPHDLEALRALAIEAARAGAGVLRPRFRSVRTHVGSKSSSTDMVTDADRASEAAIIDVITRARPDDAILGEESGAREGTSGLRWVIDPLDGTTNFLYGIAQFCVSVAVEDVHGSLVGCVLEPIANEEFVAARGHGATCNGEVIHASTQTDLAHALVSTGFSYVAEDRERSARLLPIVLPAVRDIRRPGSCALDLAWIACGRVDGFYEELVFPWDIAAGTLLATEAGARVGMLSDVTGRGPGLMASNPAIFAPLEALLTAARDAAGLRA